MWNNAIWQNQGSKEKIEESFMTNDMAKNVKKKSIYIRRQIQPTKNLKKTQFNLH